MGLVTQRYADVQIGILLRAAQHLNNWALQHGDDQQQQIAEKMLAAIRHVAPRFTYNAPPPVPRQSKHKLYRRY